MSWSTMKTTMGPLQGDSALESLNLTEPEHRPSNGGERRESTNGEMSDVTALQSSRALNQSTVDPRRYSTTSKQTTSATNAATLPPHTPHHPSPALPSWPPPRDHSLRDYKVIYDPFTSGGRRAGDHGKDFLYRYNGEVGPGEEPLKVRDPRRDLSERNREGRGKAKLRTAFYIFEYEFDENSCGPPPPPPPRGICVSGLSPLTAAGQVRRHFSSYGTIEELVSHVDRATGAPLGLFWIKFADEEEQGQRAAQQAVSHENGRRIGNGVEARLATVVLDSDGQLCRDKFNQEMEQRRKAWEESRGRNGTSNLSHKTVASSSSPLSQPVPVLSPIIAPQPTFPGLPNRPQPPSKGTGYRPAPAPSPERPDRSPVATSMRPPGPSKGRITPSAPSSASSPSSRNGTTRPTHLPVNPSPLHLSSPLPNASPRNLANGVTIEKPKPAAIAEIPPVDEEENHRDTLRLLALNGNEHIKIEKSSLPDESKSVEMDIRRFFGAYKVDRVLKDVHGWYISFDVSSDARRALAALGDKNIAGRPVVLAVHPAPSIATLATTSTRPRQGRDWKEWSETEFIQEARKIIMRDLMGVFAKDLRERVARPKAWKLVDEALETHNATEEKEAEDLPVPEAPTTPAPAEVSVSTPKGLKGLSFKRQHQHVKVDINIFNRLTPQNRINLLNILNKKNATNETAPITLPIPSPPPPAPVSPPKPKVVPAAILVREEPDTESDEAVNVARFERTLKRRKAGLDRPLHKRQRLRRKVEFSDSDHSDTCDRPTPKSHQSNGVDFIAHSPPLPTGKRKAVRLKQRELPLENKEEPVAAPTRAFSPVPKDEEIPVPTQSPIPDTSLPDGVEIPDPYAQQLVDDEEDLYYVRLLLGKQRGIEFPISAVARPPQEDTSNYPPGLRKHVTGSARTEGHYKIPEAAKSLYLPQRNRAIVDVSAVAPLPVASSRSNRANSRRLAQGMEQHKGKATDTSDVLKFNQLRTRKKQLTFSRSPIHDWGLYAAEVIPAGDMVIEYVGEVIRQQVADKREKYYEKTGIGSSYLFRVDDDSVVDATKKGNLGRLINHCCAPNCTAKIITINGEKKIVIYAKTNIDAGDEITYDYHFPLEDQKIPCLCGSPKCRGFLN